MDKNAAEKLYEMDDTGDLLYRRYLRSINFNGCSFSFLLRRSSSKPAIFLDLARWLKNIV